MEMQGAPTLQRNSQRRTNTASEDYKSYQYAAPPTPTQPTYNGTSNATSARSSSGSGGGAATARSGSGKRRDPSQQLSQIEKSVTHLLIATKQLLETLTQWSRHQATEGEVSDVYVRLGYEFNIACRAFTSIGVDIGDLGNVPDLLRAILEDTLSQDPSPASLDRYLPRIRDIIINLLHGLKRKQQKLRTRPDSNGQADGPRQGSMASSLGGSGDADPSAISNDDQSRFSASESTNERSNSYSSSYPSDETQSSQNAASARHNGSQPHQDQIEVPADVSSQLNRRPPPSNLSDSSLENLPIQHPSPTSTSMEHPGPPPLPPSNMIPKDFPAPPPVPPAQPRAQDALAQLQRGGDLERRASRRYSAYQIQKHLGQSPGSVPMIPPAQHGPIPNRGREQRDSLNAVRSRSSLIRQRSSRLNDVSPPRSTFDRQAPGEQKTLLAPNQQGTKREGSPLNRQAAHKDDIQPQSPVKASMRATLTGPLDMTTVDYSASPGESPGTLLEQTKPAADDATTKIEQQAARDPFVPAQSPEPGKPLTLFLQYKSKIKKYVLPDGANDLTQGRLQLAFIEKFAWHGVDLPEIYIQDPVSGVRHELEDLSDVRDRTVLVLNVEAVDEVKRHFDGALGGIQSAIDSMRNVVEKQQSSLQQVSLKQEETSKEMARLASVPSQGRAPSSGRYQVNGARALSGEHITEVQTLRRDLAIMRQTLTTFTSGINSSVTAIRDKAASVKAKALNASLPPSEGESGRAYVNAGKKTVGEDSENLVNRVDDLQDVVEELRKDVTRGVRPLPEQVNTVTSDISIASELLKKMKATVKKEKPVWTKIWEKELELVCTDREFLTLQEELIADLEDDLEKANQTFALVQEATKQQHQTTASGGTGVKLRSTSHGFFPSGPDIDPETARAGVMGEVRALQPNHETRLEAIERAEKARKKELATRKDGEFTKELSRFVEDGKLRKTGGVDEIERVRLIRDDANLKTTWDVEQEEKIRRKKERAEKKKREAAERAAQAEAEASSNADETLHPAEVDVEAGQIDHLQQQLQQHQADESFPREGVSGYDTFAQNGFHDAQEQTGANDENGDEQRKSWLPAIFTG